MLFQDDVTLRSSNNISVLSFYRYKCLVIPLFNQLLNPKLFLAGLKCPLPQIGDKHDSAGKSSRYLCTSYQTTIVFFTKGLVVFFLINFLGAQSTKNYVVSIYSRTIIQFVTRANLFLQKNKTWRPSIGQPNINHWILGSCNPPLSYGKYRRDHLSLGFLLFQIKFRNSFLVFGKNEGGGANGIS